MNDFTNKKTAVALGTFDGLHKGHISVITPCIEKAKEGLTPLVLLFSKHPSFYIKNTTPTTLITDNYRNKLIKKLNCEYYVLDFEKIRNLSGEEFVKNILKDTLNAEFISCGFNYRFAKDGKCTTDDLKALCKKYNIELNISPEIKYKGEAVSSSRIRQAIKDGNIQEANNMLSRPFSFDFEIIHGDEIGRTLGFPTANQHFPDNFTIPKFGVYASQTIYNGKKYPSVSNIGIRPTINGSDLRCETHIIGLNDNLYGKNPEIMLISYIRDEKKFADLTELKIQISSDSEKAIEIFSNRKDII